jgi:hypothetical protein
MKIILMIYIQIIIIINSQICNYDSNYGECNGPLERTLSKRNNSNINYGCDLGKIYYQELNNSQIKCSECIPYNIINPNIKIDVQYCNQNNYFWFMGCNKESNKKKLCKDNYFCNESGNCQEIVKSSFYNTHCNNKMDCKIPELDCINKRCLVCVEGQVISGLNNEDVFILKTTSFYERRSIIRSRKECNSGQFNKSWFQMEENITYFVIIVILFIKSLYYFCTLQ